MKTFYCEFCKKDFSFDDGRSFGAHKTNCVENPSHQIKIERIKEKITKIKFEFKFNCVECNKEFTLLLTKTCDHNNKKRKKCCSLVCARRHAANAVKEKCSKKKKCKKCNKEFTRSQGGTNSYCVEHKRGNGKPTSHRALKEFLIKQKGHKCENCKNEFWMNEKIPIQLDHIDGNCDNNEDNNLRLLCPNCHSLTETYGGKNKHKFITKRNSYRKDYRS
jgi:hypothetical protein